MDSRHDHYSSMAPVSIIQTSAPAISNGVSGKPFRSCLKLDYEIMK